MRIAHTFGLDVVAEGREDGNRDGLREMGCDRPGLFYAPAMSVEQFIEWWERVRREGALDTPVL